MYYVDYTNENQAQWKVALVDCYKAVFAAPPWNEDWWTDDLVEDVLNRYSGPHARIVLAVQEDTVVGFVWGSIVLVSDLSAELGLLLPLPASEKVGYIKDVGVTESYRQQGVAKLLLKELLSSMTQGANHPSLVLARTLATPEPSVLYRWFPKIGFEILVSYPDESDHAGEVVFGGHVGHVTF